MSAHLNIRAPYAWGLVVIAALAVVALVVSLQAAIVGLLAIVVAFWAWQNPTSAFLLLLVVSPLLPMFKITQTFGSITLLKDIILVICLARLVIRPLWQRTLPYRRNLIWLPLLSLVLWVALATLRADILLLGILRARELTLYIAAFFIALYLPHKKDLARELVGWLLAAYVMVVIVAGYQWWFAQSSAVLRFDPARQIWIPRISSTLAHPSVFGEYLVLIGITSGSLAWIARKQREKIVLAAVALSCLPLIYLTYSRAVWIAVVAAIGAGVLAYGYQRWREAHTVAWRKVFGYSLVALIAAASVIQFTPVGVFLKSAFDTSYRSNEVRLEYVARLVAPVTNSEAIVGRGLGDVVAQNYREVKLTSYDIASTSSRTVQLAKDSTLVDNQYLKTFIELGLVGLLIYVWLFARLLRGSLQLLRNEQTRAAGTVGVSFLAAFAVQALFIDVWDIFPTNLAFWTLAGIISAYQTPELVTRQLEA